MNSNLKIVDTQTSHHHSCLAQFQALRSAAKTIAVTKVLNILHKGYFFRVLNGNTELQWSNSCYAELYDWDDEVTNLINDLGEFSFVLKSRNENLFYFGLLNLAVAAGLFLVSRFIEIEYLGTHALS